MDIQAIYAAKGRDPRYFPLFERVWKVLYFSLPHNMPVKTSSSAWPGMSTYRIDLPKEPPRRDEWIEPG